MTVTGNGKNKRWITDSGRLVGGVNIRRDEKERDVWRPAGIPVTVRNDSWIPLQEVTLPGTGRRALFMLSGQTLGAILCAENAEGMDALHGTVDEIGIITGKTLRFDVVEAGVVRVLMRHSRTIYITYRQGEAGAVTWQLHGIMPDMPPLSIVTADETSLSENFEPMTLSGNGGTYGNLHAGDEKTISDRITNAYARLKAKASGMGFFIQPTLARYRLLDAAGDTIATSPVIMTGPTGMFQCTDDIRLTSSDSLATLSGGAITARGYRLKIAGFTTMPQPWRQMVRSVVIETLPQIDPVDPDSLCSAVISTNGTTATVAVRLPGCTGTAEANAMRQHSLIIKALESADSHFLLQGSFPTPFDTIVADSRVGLRDDAPAATDKIPCNAPCRDDISFGACHESGGEMFLADRRRDGFKGYAPAMFAIGKGAGDSVGCVAAVCVRSMPADGGTATIVTTSEGEAANIAAFSPLLIFPDPAATAMSLSVAREEGTYTETYPLARLPRQGIAYYLSPDMSPIYPRAISGSMTLPESTPARKRIQTERGYLYVGHPLHVATPYAQRMCTRGSIQAIADAPRSRATWDFARRKLLLFGGDGTHLVTIDNKGGIRSTAQLDNRPVSSPAAVCTAAGTQGIKLIAVAGGDLIEVSQSAVTTLMRHCRGERPGWCSRFGEIWLGGTAAPLRRVTAGKNGCEEIVADIMNNMPYLPLQWGANMLLTGEKQLLDTSEERFPDEGVTVMLTTRHNPATYPVCLRLNLFASAIAGKIVVSGDNGSHIGAPLLTLKTNGALNAPLPLRLVAPQRDWIELQLDATVNGDTEWRSPQFLNVR